MNFPWTIFLRGELSRSSPWNFLPNFFPCAVGIHPNKKGTDEYRADRALRPATLCASTE